MRPVYQNESKTNRCFWTLAQFRTASSRYNWTALRHPQQSCGVRMIWMLKSACWKRPSPQDPHQTDGMCFVDLCIVFLFFSMAVWSFALQAVWHPEGEGSLEFVDLGQRFVKNRTWNGIHSISNCYWFFLVQSLCKFHTHVNIVNRGFTAFNIFKDI